MKHEPMTPERLDAIRARVDAAARGPWAHDFCGNVDQVETQAHATDARIADNLTPGDADLIAHAPQDLTDLLAEVERLRERLTVDDEMIRRANEAAGQGLGYWESSSLKGIYGEGMFLTAEALRAALGTQEEPA